MQPFVSAIFPERVTFESLTSEQRGALCVMRTDDSEDSCFVAYSSESELVALLSRVRDLSIPFLAAGPGWHPAAVLEQLRERGLIAGEFRTIVWSGPGAPCIGTA
jgi:hypothetical protein